MNTLDRVRVLAIAAVVLVALMSVSAQVNRPKTSDGRAATKPSSTQAASAASAVQPDVANPVVGGGTAGFLPLWVTRHGIINSIAFQDATGLNVAGTVTASSFAGDGSGLINVNALSLQGLSASSIAQLGAANTFTADQTFTGKLNLTGLINNSLMLQGNLVDPLGEQGANVIGGYGGDPSGAYPGNSVGAGVIGATIAGGGGTYDSASLPPHALPEVKHGPTSNVRLVPGQTLQSKRRRQPLHAEPAEDTSPPIGIVSGANAVVQDSNWSTIGGGLKNTAGGVFSTVAGGFANTTSGNYATIGGGDVNTVSGDRGTVAGGTGNMASAPDTSIVGGYLNNATGQYGVVAGGNQNSAGALLSSVGGGGAYSDDFDQIYYGGNQAAWLGDTVSGGRGNVANSSDYPDFNACFFDQTCSATVGGGDANSALTGAATVSGGFGNLAGAPYSTVPGGYGNKAAGYGSFAGGVGAVANYNGSFVWNPTGDNTYAGYLQLQVQDLVAQQFVAGAPGGVLFESGFDSSGVANNGVLLPAGSGSWLSFSDRNVKDNFASIDADGLLTKIVALPISTWNYKTENPSIRHMGPTAQDFRAAFGLGEDDKHIATIDSEGVALAGIQALCKLVQDKDAKIAELAQALKDKDQKLDELERRLSRLEQAAGLANDSATTAESNVPRAVPKSPSAP